MRTALEDAGLRPEMIDYLNVHGTGTQANDSSEASAIRLTYGRHTDFETAVDPNSKKKSFMTKSMFLSGFASKLPQYFRPQQEAFEWLAAAHARAAVIASGQEDDLAKWQERTTRQLKRYSCSPEFIGQRDWEIADFMYTDWAHMMIFNLHENPRGHGLGIRNGFYSETANRVVEALFAGIEDPPSDLLHVSCTRYVSPSAV
jgi:hypothetical protein